MGIYRRPDSPVWWLYLETTHQKERTAFRVGTTTSQRRDSRKLANDRYHQRMNEIAARLYRLPSAQPAIRFAAYAPTYEQHVLAHQRAAARASQHLRHLRAFFDDDLLTTIDVDRVRAYHSSRASAASPRTINREVDLLKSMLRDAAPKYLTESPLKGMRRLRVVQPKRRLLMPDEEARLLKVGDAEDRALLILGIDTLMRLGDLLDLQRSDHNGAWLYVRDPKSGEPYEVALSPRAQRALAALPKTPGPILPKFRRSADPLTWTLAVRQHLAVLCARAKVPYGKAQEGITFHWATRRTGATRMLMNQGVPLPVVQRQGNWKHPNVLLQIYADVGKADLLKAVGALPAHSRARRKRA